MSKLIFYRDKKREHRWRFVASNGRTLADSGEGYKRILDVQKAFTVLWLAVTRGEYETVFPKTPARKAKKRGKK